MNELLERAKPREDIIRALRKKAAQGGTVRELVQEICSRLGILSEPIIPILWYFTEAFGLSLSEVLPIREWIGTEQDRTIDALILPVIAKHREKWNDFTDGNAVAPRSDGA